MKNRKVSRKLLTILVLFTVLYSALFCMNPSFIETVYADGEDWLEGWDWRKSHLINPSTGAGTLYQIRLTAYYGAGADTSTTVYLNSKSQEDFEDVRFTDNDGSTLLDHWIYERSNSSYCIFWVEVADSLSSSSVTIYIYYGNSTVGTTSSGVDTFIQFDDFESYSEAFNLDGVGIWDAATYAQYWRAEVNSAWGGSDFGGRLYMSNNYWSYLYTVPISETNGIAVGMRHYRNANDGHNGFWGLIEGATQVTTAWDNSGNVKTHNSSNYYEMNPELDWAFQTWMEQEFRAYRNASHQIWQIMTDDVVYSHVGNMQVNITVGLTQFKVWNQRYGGGHDRIWIDNFYVRKWVAPEPAQDSFGNESYKPSEYITFYNQSNGVFMTDGVKRLNGTYIISSNDTVLELQGIINISSQFIEFDWISSNAEINPYNYTVAGNDTIWLMVDPVGAGGGVVLPEINVVGFNETVGSQGVAISLTFHDDTGLSHYILSHNASGAWANMTWRSLAGTDDSSIENVTLPVADTQFGVIAYCNNTSGDWATLTDVSFDTATLAGAADVGGGFAVGILTGIGFGLVVFAPLMALMIIKGRRNENGYMQY